jgi:hypothetical protein
MRFSGVDRRHDYRNAGPLFGFLHSLGYFGSSWCKDRMGVHCLGVLLEVDGSSFSSRCLNSEVIFVV